MEIEIYDGEDLYDSRSLSSDECAAISYKTHPLVSFGPVTSIPLGGDGVGEPVEHEVEEPAYSTLTMPLGDLGGMLGEGTTTHRIYGADLLEDGDGYVMDAPVCIESEFQKGWNIPNWTGYTFKDMDGDDTITVELKFESEDVSAVYVPLIEEALKSRDDAGMEAIMTSLVRDPDAYVESARMTMYVNSDEVVDDRIEVSFRRIEEFEIGAQV